jgi:RNA polymerase sigma factor (sigma-70 family)
VGTDDPELERVEDQVAWHQMVDELEPRLRRVIELRYWENLPQFECARRLGVSQTLVSVLERRALNRLRNQADLA